MNDLLLELGTEELPPPALLSLSEAFTQGLCEGLGKAGLNSEGQQGIHSQSFASPRRLAVLMRGIADTAPDKDVEKLGPNIKAAYDKDGQPSKAALGFARSCGVEFSELSQVNTDKGERLAYRQREPGRRTADILQEALLDVLNKLPIPKRMRWAARRDEFIRPVKWLLALHGAQTIELEAYGVRSASHTRGHRFMGQDNMRGGELAIGHASDYEQVLREKGYVLADFEQRKKLIEQQLLACGEQLGGQIVIGEDLLNEVCSLVEWPCCLAGEFDTEFLQLPKEVLISSMRSHQKYFHVLDAQGELMPHFVTVANIDSKDPAQVIAGNQRVIRPRLADAQFFFRKDSGQSLDSMAERLASVVFQDKLGSIGDKVARIEKLAAWLGEHSSLDSSASKADCSRAARLCKADLVSDMVGEFADLQGTMGRYYARLGGESEEVSTAIEEHYLPRFAGDALPQTASGKLLSLADRLDTLVGIFGIGQAPTGSKDPFALRRASLGLLRILIEGKIALPLRDAIQQASSLHQPLPNKDQQSTDQESKALAYIIERLRSWYGEKGNSGELIQSVLELGLDDPLDIDRRIAAVAEFSKMEQAAALAAANKRVSNLLSKQESDVDEQINTELLREPQEQALAEQLAQQQQKVSPLLAEHKYTEALSSLAGLKQDVDAFFDAVMVMDEDLALRNNRLALLKRLHSLFGQIADISQLA